MIEFTCERCGGCCKPGFEGADARSLIVTHDDQRSIARYLNLTVRELCEKYRINSEQQSIDVSHTACPFLEDPIPLEQIHREAPLMPNGNMGPVTIEMAKRSREQHCRIHEAKPLVCQRWPTSGTLNCPHVRAKMAPYCPAMGKYLSARLHESDLECNQLRVEIKELVAARVADKEQS